MSFSEVWYQIYSQYIQPIYTALIASLLIPRIYDSLKRLERLRISVQKGDGGISVRIVNTGDIAVEIDEIALCDSENNPFTKVLHVNDPYSVPPEVSGTRKFVVPAGQSIDPRFDVSSLKIAASISLITVKGKVFRRDLR